MGSLFILAVASAAVGLSWLALVLLTLVGRASYDRKRGVNDAPVATLERVLRHARAHRGELGKWRRVTALRALGRSASPAARAVLEAATRDLDSDVVGAAIRALGEAGTTYAWAVDSLIEALEQGRGPRSRVAAQLEQLAPRPGERLLPLLDHSDSEVRFWAVALLARYGTQATGDIRKRTYDRDPSVRAEAAETLGAIGDETALDDVLRLLGDDEWFVRAHACRAAATLGDVKVAERLMPLLGDDRWWVRTAAKDGIRMLGPDTLRFLEPLLDSPDRFARNGAAELLQDLGIVDWLAREKPDSDLLRRIFAAGGERLRAAAMQRLAEPRAVEAAEAVKVA